MILIMLIIFLLIIVKKLWDNYRTIIVDGVKYKIKYSKKSNTCLKCSFNGLGKCHKVNCYEKYFVRCKK